MLCFPINCYPVNILEVRGQDCQEGITIFLLSLSLLGLDSQQSGYPQASCRKKQWLPTGIRIGTKQSMGSLAGHLLWPCQALFEVLGIPLYEANILSGDWHFGKKFKLGRNTSQLSQESDCLWASVNTMNWLQPWASYSLPTFSSLIRKMEITSILLGLCLSNQFKEQRTDHYGLLYRTPWNPDVFDLMTQKKNHVSPMKWEGYIKANYSCRVWHMTTSEG